VTKSIFLSYVFLAGCISKFRRISRRQASQLPRWCDIPAAWTLKVHAVFYSSPRFFKPALLQARASSSLRFFKPALLQACASLARASSSPPFPFHAVKF
jgi:hypothetical protein